MVLQSASRATYRCSTTIAGLAAIPVLLPLTTRFVAAAFEAVPDLQYSDAQGETVC